MAYIYDTATGRICGVVLQGTPTLPSGFDTSDDAIEVEDLLQKKRDIGSGVLMNRDALVISGADAVPVGRVGQVAIKKIDGTTLEDKDDAGDDDAVAYVLEDDVAFKNKATSALVNGADSLKIAAPAVEADARFLVYSPELQLLDTKVRFS